MSNLKSNIKEIKKGGLKTYELHYIRIVCLAGGILYPMVGLILKLLNKNASEYLSHRLTLTILFFTIILGSYKSVYIKKHARTLTIIILWISCFWAIWITYHNNFHFNYTLVMLTAISATASIYIDRILITAFLLTSTVAILISIYFAEGIGFDPLVLPLSIIILLTIYNVNEYYREQILIEVETLTDKVSLINLDLEGKVKRRTSLLEQKNRELEQITYVVSHDLKSPLRNINSFASLIDRKIKNKEFDNIESYTETINNAVIKMSALIEDLLEYGKVGQTDEFFEETNFEKLINEIIANNFSSDNNTNINITSSFPQQIVCNKKQIYLILQNLINNSIKYNESEIIDIQIFYKSSPSHHRICIKDNGIGVNPKYKDKVFEMFGRLHSSGQYEGTGIGLSICKKIALLHQGNIDFKSTENKGSTFWFEIDKNLSVG